MIDADLLTRAELEPDAAELVKIAFGFGLKVPTLPSGAQRSLIRSRLIRAFRWDDPAPVLTRWGAVAALGGDPRDYHANQFLHLSLAWLHDQWGDEKRPSPPKRTGDDVYYHWFDGKEDAEIVLELLERICAEPSERGPILGTLLGLAREAAVLAVEEPVMGGRVLDINDSNTWTCDGEVLGHDGVPVIAYTDFETRDATKNSRAILARWLAARGLTREFASDQAAAERTASEVLDTVDLAATSLGPTARALLNTLQE